MRKLVGTESWRSRVISAATALARGFDAMSEVGRAQLRAWRWPYLLLSATAIIALLAVAMSGAAVVPVTALGTLANTRLSLFLSVSRPAVPHPSGTHQPLQGRRRLAGAAR